MPIAYLKHMFEDALKEKERRRMSKRFLVSMDSTSRPSSFDQESEKEEFVAKLRRDSAGR